MIEPHLHIGPIKIKEDLKIPRPPPTTPSQGMSTMREGEGGKLAFQHQHKINKDLNHPYRHHH